jgi:nicotinate-nucleotide adenylyltransferase
MIVVFGGAFNPVTKAHIEVCDFVLNQYPSSRFVFLPVSSAYTKSDLASNYHRVNMLELAIKERDNVSINMIEISDSDFLGTYQSLLRIADRYQDDVYFVVGADNLIGMENWINIEGILSEFNIIVLGRDNIDPQKAIVRNSVLKRHLSSFIIFEDFEMKMSSTGFRKSFDKSLVDIEVYDYIIENELYRGEEDV